MSNAGRRGEPKSEVVLETAGGKIQAGDRVTGYSMEDRDINGITNGITGGGDGGGASRRYSKSVTSPTVIGGTGIDTSGVTNGRNDEISYTTGGSGISVSGDYDKGHSTTTSTIPIHTSHVVRDPVLLASPGIKESNSNLTSYMTDIGVDSRLGIIPGTSDSARPGTRTYTAGEGSSTSARTNGNIALCDDFCSGPYTHNVGKDSTTRAAEDLNIGSYHMDPGCGTGYGLHEDSFASSSGSSLSSRQHPASRPGLETDPSTGKRPYFTSESPPTSINMMSKGKSCSRDLTPSTDSRTDIIREGPSLAAGKVVSTAANTGSYLPGTGKDFASDIGLTSGSGYEGPKSYPGKDASITTAVVNTAANVASYITDTAKGVASGIGFNSDSQTDPNTSQTHTTSERSSTYGANKGPAILLPYTIETTFSTGPTPNTSVSTNSSTHGYDSSEGTSLKETIKNTATDATSYVINIAKDISSGIDLTSGSGAGAGATTNNKTYNNGGDSPTTGRSESYGILPYIEDVASRATPHNSTSSGKHKHTPDERTSMASSFTDTAEITASPGSRSMPGSYAESRGNSYTTLGMKTRAGFGGGGSVSYRGGAYLSGKDSLSTTDGMSGGTTEETHNITYPNLAANWSKDEQAHKHIDHERIDYELGDRVEMEIQLKENEYMDYGSVDGECIDRERLGSLGERYIINCNGNTTILDPSLERGTRIEISHDLPGIGETCGVINRNRDFTSGDGRVKREHHEEPSIIYNGTSQNLSRVSLNLEQENHNTKQEALGIARERNAAEPTGMDTPNKITSPHQKYSSLVNQEPPPLEFSHSHEKMGCTTGSFDTPGRYYQDPRISEAGPQSNPKVQKTPQDTHRDNPRMQPGKLPHKDETPLSPNTGQRQAAYGRDRERSIYESSTERKSAAGLSRSRSSALMKTTMRDSPEYREQKMDDSGRVVTSERERGQEMSKIFKSQFDDDDLGRKGFLGRAANKMGSLMRA